MKTVEQSITLLNPSTDYGINRRIEQAARTCYDSQPFPRDKEGLKKLDAFVRSLISRGHESVIEHVNLSFEIVTDRGVMAELTRHRLASFSIQSTRYCRYNDPKSFMVIAPMDKDAPGYETWLKAMRESQKAYNKLLAEGHSPQIARSVLPQSFATKIFMTVNLRELRHILRLRTSSAAHPQIRALFKPLLADFRKRYPALVFDIPEC
jgi:thymidylate synthase (FAD)